MRIPVIIIAIILGALAAFVAYNYLNQPRSAGDRIDSAVSELGNGNLGEAVDEAGNQTVGDKISDDVKDATTPATAQ